MTLYDTKPANFTPKFHATGVYLECDDEILLLQRHPLKPEGGTWCVAGGKVDAGETPLQAAIRETREEIGVTVEHLEHIGTYYVQYQNYAFIYSVFRAPLQKKPHIVLKADEHTAYRWMTPQHALTMPLIEDEDAVLCRAYGVKNESR